MTEIKLHVEDSTAFFERARELARALDEDRQTSAEHHLSFGSLEALLCMLTPDRWVLLRTLKARGASSVRGLALELGRGVDVVRSDVDDLAAAGLVDRASDGRIKVPWSRIVAEADLHAA